MNMFIKNKSMVLMVSVHEPYEPVLRTPHQMIRAVPAGSPEGSASSSGTRFLGRKSGGHRINPTPMANACALSFFQMFDESVELANIVVLLMRFDCADVNFFEQRDLQNYI
ncbi:MAG: hypothetical protein ACLGSA_12815 [Acidobacteriota bacterium]